MEDHQAIRLVLNGEEEAYEEIIRRHHRGIFRLAYRLVWSESEAEDIVQETFMKAFRSLKSFDQAQPFSPWLNTICVNTAYRHLKRRRSGGRETELKADVCRSDNPSPEKTTVDRMRLRQVQHALDTLPPAQQVTLTLRALEGLSYKEIASRQNCSIGTVMSRLSRARAMLKDRLQGENHEL